MLRSVYEAFRRSFALGASVIGVFLGLAAWVTYTLGGTTNSYPHLFYIPVVIAGALHGAPGGAIVGLVAGILCGPWMPKDVVLGIMQPFENWAVRGLIFIGIGALVGDLISSLRAHIRELRDLNEQTIVAFVQAVDAKDPHTAKHSMKVAEYAVQIARELGFTDDEAERVRRAALLHDVGKIAVPGVILNKPGKLTADEWETIKRHPVDSVRIIEGVEYFRPYVAGVRHHHERMDGEGYPDRLRGEAVPLDARIIAVADAFDAMTSSRAYRPALSKEAAVTELKACAGRQFDEQVVLALIRALDKKRSGRTPKAAANAVR